MKRFADRKARAHAARNRKQIAAVVLLGILFLVYFIKLSEPIAVFFAKSLSRPLRTAAGFLTSFVPFSVTEFAIIIAVVCGIALLISMLTALFKRRWRKLFDKLSTLVLIVCTVSALYAVTAQFDYERPEPEKPWLSADLGAEEFRALALRYAADAARLAESFPKDDRGYTVAPSFEETAKKMQKEVLKYAGGDYVYYVPLPKKVLNSWEMDLTAILGLTFAPLNEVNMNANISGLDLPYYMAHELAHSLGIMTEREANIFAAFVTLNSDEPYIRYSGYRALLYDLVEPLGLLDAPEKGYLDRARAAAERFGVPFPEDAVFSEEDDSFALNPDLWDDFLNALKLAGGLEAAAVINGWGETETEFRRTLAGSFQKDAEIRYYAANLPDWMSGFEGFFNRIGRWINNLYLKQSGIFDGTENYNTGGSALLPSDPSNLQTPRIDYSETLKIMIWIDGVRQSAAGAAA